MKTFSAIITTIVISSCAFFISVAGPISCDTGYERIAQSHSDGSSNIIKITAQNASKQCKRVCSAYGDAWNGQWGDGWNNNSFCCCPKTA